MIALQPLPWWLDIMLRTSTGWISLVVFLGPGMIVGASKLIRLSQNNPIKQYIDNPKTKPFFSYYLHLGSVFPLMTVTFVSLILRAVAASYLRLETPMVVYLIGVFAMIALLAVVIGLFDWFAPINAYLNPKWPEPIPPLDVPMTWVRVLLLVTNIVI